MGLKKMKEVVRFVGVHLHQPVLQLCVICIVSMASRKIQAVAMSADVDLVLLCHRPEHVKIQDAG
jgi:hypothetical protein